MCGQCSSSTRVANVPLVGEWSLLRPLLGCPGADFIDTFQGRVF